MTLIDKHHVQYLFTPGTQNHRVLTLLQRGPVTNVELAANHHILKYTSRMSEVRAVLRRYLVDIHAERIPGTGTVVYSLRGGSL
jgi:hypothetical protein